MNNHRVKSPNPNVESKVAKYIKYGQIDLKNEPAKLTAAVYLRNLRTTQSNEKLMSDKNQSERERKVSKSSREVFNRLAQPKLLNSVQIVKKKQHELLKPAMLQSQVMMRTASKEVVTEQSKVFNVKNKTLKMAKSKSPLGNTNKSSLMQDNASTQSKNSKIPPVQVIQRKASQTRMNSSKALRPQSPNSGLKSPTPIKKPSMFSKTKRATVVEKQKPNLTERGRALSAYKNPSEKASSSKPPLTAGESTKSSVEIQKQHVAISVQINSDQLKSSKKTARSPLPPSVRPGSARAPLSNRAKPPPTPIKLPTTPLKTMTLTPTQRKLETQSSAAIRMPRPASVTSRKKRKQSEPPKLSAEEQLRMLRESILTELDKEDGLQYVIDIARPLRSANLIIKELNRSLKVLRSDGLFKSINWVDGIDYDSQFSEIVLPMVDQIVTNHQGDFMSPNQSVSLAKQLEIKGFKSYSDKSLQKSIDKIYGCLYGKRSHIYVGKLLNQVQESLQSIQVYTNDLEICPYAKEYCMAIMFYLGHFENEECEEVQITEMEIEQSAAHVLAHTQQTQNFRSWQGDVNQNCLDTCKKELKEVTWWINRAIISGVRKFHGKCTRKIQIAGNKELAYYQVGKVFRFQNIISANIDGKGDPNQYEANSNVHFHIYSQGGGRCVQQFLGAGSGVETATGHTILFPSGSEFMICKREEDNDKEVTHIYLREINIGLSKQSALILDEDVYLPKYNCLHKSVREAKIDDRGSYIPSLVFKQQSQLAKAYFQSKLFEKALTICDTYKVIQSLERKNEDCLVWNSDNMADRKLAGARFLDELESATEALNPDLKKKMEVAIFCPDTTLEEVEQTFKQYKEGGDLILSQNLWRDSNVKVLRSMKSLAEFIGVPPDLQTLNELESSKSDKPKRPNLLT